MKNRIKQLRDSLGISQEEFGKRIGVTGAAVSGYESGRRSVLENIAKSICREFDVDYYWLTEGVGEMKLYTANSIVEELVKEKGLNENSKKIILAYLEMNEQERLVIEKYFLNIAEKLKKENDEK